MTSKNDMVRVGIIGCGGIANGKHMPALKKVKNVEMVAFCDIIPERAEKAIRFLKIAAVVPLLKQQGLLDLFAGG